MTLRFRYHIRTLLITSAIVAICLGGVYWGAKIKRRRYIVNTTTVFLERMGWDVQIDDRMAGKVNGIHPPRTLTIAGEFGSPERLGPDAVYVIANVDNIVGLRFRYCEVPGTVLTEIAEGAGDLQYMEFYNCEVASDALAAFRKKRPEVKVSIDS